MMVRDFQSVIGREARRQILEPTGRLPDAARGLRRRRQQRHGAVLSLPGRRGASWSGSRRPARDRHRPARGAPSAAGSVGVLHGTKSYLLQDADGQIQEAHSISAGLDYPGVGPEHAFLKEPAAPDYVAVDGRRGPATPSRPSRRLEGIIPALESAHALAWRH